MPRFAAVMYHYVRPLRRSRFPAIKGLDLELFRAQLDYLQNHATIVPAEAMFAPADEELPPRAVVLTFDDGYIDHYTYVFPELCRRGLTGAFYPPACAVRDRVMLDVNKIHFTLAACTDTEALVEDMETLLAARAAEFALRPLAEYRQDLMVPNRFDPASVNYFKRMLQHALPPALRAWIADRLFERHVSVDQATFAEEIYVSLDQLQVMRQGGMVIGGHGDQHLWLDKVDDDTRLREVAVSADLLDECGVATDRRSFCYPYGGNDAPTRDLLLRFGFSVAFCTEVDVADTARQSLLQLPRLDTSHLPRDPSAPFDEWLKCLAE
jgi:peptidoglycan/xylan/chitin deacetylase (PgdA/CDA1 family)